RHVEIDAGDIALHAVPGLGGSRLEVDFNGTGAVAAGLAGQHAKFVIAAITVDLANGRHQVMQVAFHHPELGIGGFAVGAAPILPALPSPAPYRRGYHMLPFDPAGALGTLADLVAASGEVGLVAARAGPLNPAPTVKALRMFGIDPLGQALGFFKRSRR